MQQFHARTVIAGIFCRGLLFGGQSPLTGWKEGAYGAAGRAGQTGMCCVIDAQREHPLFIPSRHE